MIRRQCKPVTVGTVGAGFAAGLHGDGYLHVCSVPVRLKTVADPDLERAEHIREAYGYERAVSDWRELHREPLSTLDLAIRVTKILYAAYCSAEEGCRIDLSDL